MALRDKRVALTRHERFDGQHGVAPVICVWIQVRPGRLPRRAARSAGSAPADAAYLWSTHPGAELYLRLRMGDWNPAMALTANELFERGVESTPRSSTGPKSNAELTRGRDVLFASSLPALWSWRRAAIQAPSPKPSSSYFADTAVWPSRAANRRTAASPAAFATLLLGAGEEIAVISKMLGHADYSTTVDVYSHSRRSGRGWPPPGLMDSSSVVRP